MEVFSNYPLNSRENPFDLNSKGKYFAYLTNRQNCFSYLSEELSDFDWKSKQLYSAMPMGYTDLWVLERLFLINTSGAIKLFSNENYSKIVTFRSDGFPKPEWSAFVDDGWKDRIQDCHRVFFEKDNIDDTLSMSREILKRIEKRYDLKNLTILGAGLINDHYWH